MMIVRGAVLLGLVAAVAVLLYFMVRLNLGVIWAIFKRDFLAYFGNPTGYLFLAVFVGLTQGMSYNWNNMFFSRNIVDLQSMNVVLPWLLVGFVPTITMSSWSNERREGTDALLFTMPVRDSEVILGKFASCVGIYTIALTICMFTQIAFLLYLGSPDVGLMCADFLGCWLLGVFFVGLGIVASTFSENVTLGFVGGAFLCLVFLVVGLLPSYFSLSNSYTGSILQAFSANHHFDTMTKGMITLEDLFCFVGGTGLLLYLNLLILSKRLWA
ncbi:MAG: ABC-2 transporter permease [Planctomycetota bacterium]